MSNLNICNHLKNKLKIKKIKLKIFIYISNLIYISKIYYIY